MSDNRRKEIFKNIIRKFKAFIFSKDALIFLFFLVLSFTFWFANALNKNREANITIPIRYSGLPKDMVIANEAPSEIRVGVKDEGMNLFAYTRKRILPLNIEFYQTSIKNGYLNMTSDQILNRLSHHLRPTTTILNFNPDSIYVVFEKLDMAKLPVVLNAEIDLAQQYIFSDSVHVVPDRITVYGTKEALDTLKEIQTQYIHLEKVKDSISTNVQLVPIEGVNFSEEEVRVVANVEMFTQKSITLPVTFINVPPTLTIKALPAEVNVSYNISTSQYAYPQEDIEVIVDYNDIKSNDLGKQKLKVINDSSKIFSVRTSPETIEYILEERNQ